MKKMWTKKDDAYLKRHWQEMSDEEIFAYVLVALLAWGIVEIIKYAKK